MQPKNELYGIGDKKNRTLLFTYRTGAGNNKKALFNDRKRAERAIADFKAVKIDGVSYVD